MPTTEDDLLLVNPGIYWVTFSSDVWPSYFKQLRHLYGKSAFKSVQSEDNGKIGVTWKVLEVYEPIEIDRGVISYPVPWRKGMTPESEGAWEQEGPHWILTAEEATEWIKARAEDAGDLAIDAKEYVEDAADQIEKRASANITKIAIVAAVAGMIFIIVNRVSFGRGENQS